MVMRRPRHSMPGFVQAALDGSQLMQAYQARPEYQRNDYIGWITNAARNETRHRRLEQMLDELRAGDVYMKMPWRQGSPPMDETIRTAPRTTVDSYLASLSDENQRSALEDLRWQIQAMVPEAEETISYGMPLFKLGGKPLISFSAAKHGCSLHTMTNDVKGEFSPDLDGYSTTKEAVHFKPGSPLPRPLLERIVRTLIAQRASGG